MTLLIWALSILIVLGVAQRARTPPLAASNSRAAGTVPATQPRCTERCEITLRQLASLTDDSKHGKLPDHSIFVLQDAAGQFITTTRLRDAVILFDRAGRLVNDSTSANNGVAQFRRIATVLPGLNNSFLAYDFQRRSLVTLGPNLQTISRIPASQSPAFMRRDGSFVVAKQIATAELIGHPVHLADSTLRILRSFGAEVPEHRNDLKLITERVVAPASDESVWAVPPGRYQFDRWDPTSGKRIGQVRGRTTWFTESVSSPRDENVRPTPLIEGLWEREGYLWVLVRDADASWKPPRNANAERPFDPEEYDASYDWVLEVIAPDSGRIVASRRLAAAHWGRAPYQLLASRRKEANSRSVSIELWVPELRPKEKQQ